MRLHPVCEISDLLWIAGQMQEESDAAGRLDQTGGGEIVDVHQQVRCHAEDTHGAIRLLRQHGSEA